MTRVRGFIVSAWEERQPSHGAVPRVLATGRLEDGRSFAIVRSAAAPALYVAPADAARALELLAGAHSASVDPSPWSDLAGAPLARIALAHGGLEPAARLLAARGIEVPHRERTRAADALLALGISGPVEIHGEPIPGRRVNAVFLDPELSPAKEAVPLEWLALDVETDRAETVVAVSLAGAGGAGEILFLGPELASTSATSFSTEEALLRALARRLLQRDPDVITGWNVVDFDLRVLAKRFAACGVPFDYLEERIAREFGVQSHLRIRCEKAYRRFLIPRLKSDAGEGGRGRAKGYAGLKLAPDGSAAVEIRGMEGVRSDFTPLARRFQRELLAKVFAGGAKDDLSAFCRELVRQMERGELDGELVYAKSLRRPARDYGSQTHQVRAARMLGWAEQRGRVSYVMTRAGAEPLEGRSGAPLDYAHYRDRQILPIARSIADVLGCDADAWFGAARQLELFG